MIIEVSHHLISGHGWLRKFMLVIGVRRCSTISPAPFNSHNISRHFISITQCVPVQKILGCSKILKNRSKLISLLQVVVVLGNPHFCSCNGSKLPKIGSGAKTVISVIGVNVIYPSQVVTKSIIGSVVLIDTSITGLSNTVVESYVEKSTIILTNLRSCICVRPSSSGAIAYPISQPLEHS